MSEGHVTHYDDCGCQSAALKARIATLESDLIALRAAEGGFVEAGEILAAENMAQAERIAALEASLRDAEESRDAATSLLADTRADIHWTEVIDLKRKVATLEADYQTARTAVEVESALVREARERVAALEAELAQTGGELGIMKNQNAMLKAHAATLRDALEWIVEHKGDECGDGVVNEWTEAAAFTACQRYAKKALAQTPAQSLAALKAEVLERAAKRFLALRPCEHDFSPGECEACHWFATGAQAVRALAAPKDSPSKDGSQAATHSVPDGTSEVKP